MRTRPLRLLIVEDDADFRMVLRKVVNRLPTHVPVETCFLENVADAQRILDNTHVDFVVSDYELPDGTGADVMDSAPRSHRVVLTGAPDRVHAETERRRRPHAVWDKAIGLNELRNRLLQMVSARVPLPAR